MKKTKSAILHSYDDAIRSAYQAKYVTKTLTRFGKGACHEKAI